MSTTLLLFVGVGGVFAGIFGVLAALGLLTNNVRGVSKSLAVMQAFSAVPEQMQRELEPTFNDRVLTPVLTGFLGLGKRLTPADYAERVSKKLDLAGNPAGWTVDRIISLKALGIGAGFLLGLALSALMGLSFLQGVLFCVAGSTGGYFAPNLWLYQKGYDRTNQMQRALPDALDLLTISVEAGLGFDAALSQVARNTEGPLAEEFARVLQEMQIGLGRSRALRALGERTSMPDLRSFVSAMVQADAFGIPIGQVLRVQSQEIRVKRRQRAEEQAQKIPVKIMIPLVLFILPCLFVAVLGPAIISMAGLFGGGGALG